MIDEHVGRGYLKPADLGRFLEANPAVREVELSNYGEAFLNPHLVEILRVIAEHGATPMLANGANLNHARPEMLEAVVRYGMRGLTCSIDGATQAVYERYRVGGDLERVLANIRTINEWKAKLGKSLPILYWQMVLFEHNRHEIDAARAMAKSLGMKFGMKLSWDEDLAPQDDDELLARSLGMPSVTRARTERKTGRPYLSSICHQLWIEPAVNWNGKLLGCSRNFWGDFGGNAFSRSLDQTLADEKMAYAKQMLQGQAPPRDDIPCTSCEIYRKRMQSQFWIELPKA